MQNGCICCTLREDLLEQVSELANSNEYDYLLIERFATHQYAHASFSCASTVWPRRPRC